MNKRLVSGNILIHRSDVLDGLRALFLAQHRFDRLLKEDSYTCGYREGFEDALLSVAQLIGVVEEFETARRRDSSSASDTLPVFGQIQE
jgi:hypothetical protein